MLHVIRLVYNYDINILYLTSSAKMNKINFSREETEPDSGLKML